MKPNTDKVLLGYAVANPTYEKSYVAEVLSVNQQITSEEEKELTL